MKPANAASIWIASDGLHLELPDGERSHTVVFPASQVGLRRVMMLLKAREPSSKLGQPGDLTQAQVDKAIAYDEGKVRKFPSRVRLVADSKAIEVLRRLGML